MHKKHDNIKKMENQPEENHRDERQESYVLYSPRCKFIEQLIQAFLKCLGGHVDDSSYACPKSDEQEDLDDPTPADNNNETQMKTTEDEYKAQGIGSRTPRRRPSSPISTGPPGGQINAVSPS
ncbi:hypothetical protein FNV43_RR18740 [Rhamnella rubrinervis]|uniref:Uncharacterized protein n=1 Tax=Rhamnella rubrinervis TaxID=2594499 RepID=A0A8K0GWD1_9ROSA|nr:hypothetical protein FNV43_RR18740 [Rhamnella rubrinervis]